MSNKQELEDKFYLLQDLLTDEFIDRIKSGDAEPSLLNAARQHLKDNNIHASLKQDNKMQDLVSILPFKDEEDEPIKEAIQSHPINVKCLLNRLFPKNLKTSGTSYTSSGSISIYLTPHPYNTRLLSGCKTAHEEQSYKDFEA
jgi:hypothetical protein